MYSNIAFAIALLGIFSIFELLKGNPTVTIGNPLSLSNVYITLNERPNYKLIINDSIEIKGVCTGLLSDVIINEAQVIKN